MHLELLMKYFNLGYSGVVLPCTEYGLVAVVSLSFVGAIRIEGIIRLALGIIALVCYLAIVVTSRIAAEFNSRSHSLLQNWKTQFIKKDALNHRTYQTLRKLKIMISSFGYVDTTLILTLTGVILDNSIDFLIITRSP